MWKRQRVFGITVARNEEDVLGLSLLHHHSLGLKGFLVVDNGSSDGTPRLLRRLAERLPLRWTRDDAITPLAAVRTELAREAHRLGAGWVLPFDADEFWYPVGRSLRSLLARSRAGMLICPVLNFVQRREQRERSPHAILHMTRRVANPVGPADRCQELVTSREIGFVEMEYPPKVIVRATPSVELDAGHHSAIGHGGKEVPTSSILCLHAPLRARLDLERKAEHGRRATARGARGSEAWHLRRWASIDAEGALDPEWAANSHRDGALDVGGRRHPLVADDRLAAVAGRWIPVLEELDGGP